MKSDLLDFLHEEFANLDNSTAVLRYSYETCRAIGLKDNYSLDELDRFEALTARFARLCDLLIQKVFRLIDQLDLENEGTVRDRINRAEKKGLISGASQFVQCRLLRNEIAHDYMREEVNALFGEVIKLTPELFDSVERVNGYCQKKGWL